MLEEQRGQRKASGVVETQGAGGMSCDLIERPPYWYWHFCQTKQALRFIGARIDLLFFAGSGRENRQRTRIAGEKHRHLLQIGTLTPHPPPAPITRRSPWHPARQPIIRLGMVGARGAGGGLGSNTRGPSDVTTNYEWNSRVTGRSESDYVYAPDTQFHGDVLVLEERSSQRCRDVDQLSNRSEHAERQVAERIDHHAIEGWRRRLDDAQAGAGASPA
ncbi:unnamed protein product [Vitrella brassicaformis CCMP3155]|uniref:Uncharacterized protein n=1 Tax=Vitrella brassicaformis (strain CCMP3155) TaxID=1169540 RepID=A0A0G4H394_VITBC|nr:unnamed protein product [Vitrella brassicaformis CCMP3155]|eukprot:CEM38180.1 unnamed protein product [Vitrella brassicaformis CCMP3155]